MKINSILLYLDSKGFEYSYQGDKEIDIIGYSSLKSYQPESITWIGRAESVPKDVDFEAIRLVVMEYDLHLPVKNCILVKNSKRAFFSIIEDLLTEECDLDDMGQGSYIGTEVKLGNNVKIGHLCVLDGDISVGDNTVIYNLVNIVNRVVIGKNCVIQSGVSIGHDGFGYSEDLYGNKKMIRHHGGVVIGDEVYVSANTVIQRGTIDDTIIESGTKIDTLCHIAHNAHVGPKNGIVTLSAIYGSATTGENCYIASGIVKDNTSIGDNVQIGISGVVLNDTGSNQIVVGTPARKIREKQPYKKEANES